jgi:ABC-type phosphate/phosphonate transport system substrate-binding protein
MSTHVSPPRARRRALAVLLVIAAGVLAAPSAGKGRPPAGGTLRIGTSGSLASEANPNKEQAALKTLKGLIKDETRLSNEIVRQRDWHELAKQMAAGKLQVGVFQGYEFAWARQKHPGLKPLVLAVSGQRYPIAYVVTRKDSKVKEFADLKGQALSAPTGRALPRLFEERQALAAGQAADRFFSKISTPDNVEDALDDVVDGVVQAAVVDKAGLEAYRRRKPGRFKQLKELAHSKPVLPVIIATYDEELDAATQRRFREGLLNAGRKERGQTMLTMFRLTGFEDVPRDFDEVLEQTLKEFPPEAGGK